MKKSLLVVGLIGILSLTACSSSRKEIKCDEALDLVNSYAEPDADKKGTLKYDASKDVFDDHKSGMPDELKFQVGIFFDAYRLFFGAVVDADSDYLAKDHQVDSTVILAAEAMFNNEDVPGSLKYTTSDAKDLTIALRTTAEHKFFSSNHERSPSLTIPWVAKQTSTRLK